MSGQIVLINKKIDKQNKQQQKIQLSDKDLKHIYENKEVNQEKSNIHQEQWASVIIQNELPPLLHARNPV